MSNQTYLRVLMISLIPAMWGTVAAGASPRDLDALFVHEDYRVIDHEHLTTPSTGLPWYVKQDDLVQFVRTAKSASEDIGSWLGDGKRQILVTLHGDRLSNKEDYLLTVIDQDSGKRLTPVLHYWAHHAEVLHLQGARQDFPVIIGHLAGQGYWFEEGSVIVRFTAGTISLTTVIGDLGRQLYQVHREDSKLLLLKLEGYHRDDPRSFMPDWPLWSREVLKWDPAAEKFKVEPE